MADFRVTFKMVHFPSIDAWIGVAWDYSNGVLFSTAARATYAGARAALDRLAVERSAELRYFDGEYSLADDGQTLVRICSNFMPGHKIAHGNQTGLEVGYTQIKHGSNWVVAYDREGQRYDLLESACRLDR